jgi:predicted cobalt transporter CbtA
MLTRILSVGLLAGLLAGLLIAALQQVTTTPLILAQGGA